MKARIENIALESGTRYRLVPAICITHYGADRSQTIFCRPMRSDDVTSHDGWIVQRVDGTAIAYVQKWEQGTTEWSAQRISGQRMHAVTPWRDGSLPVPWLELSASLAPVAKTRNEVLTQMSNRNFGGR